MKTRINVFLRMSVIPFLILFFGIAEGVYAQTDQDLAQIVKGKLLLYYTTDFDISELAEGSIKIKGEVTTLSDKYRVFEIAAKVPGVKKIENLITVDTKVVPDDIISANISLGLKRNHAIYEPDRIMVNVDHGFVILSGEVSDYQEKLDAHTIASWQEGVKGLDNQIILIPEEQAQSDENILFGLKEILKYQFPLDKGITMSVSHGEVTMTGQAFRLWDKIKIEEEFSKVIGVRKINNRLEVKIA